MARYTLGRMAHLAASRVFLHWKDSVSVNRTRGFAEDLAEARAERALAEVGTLYKLNTVHTRSLKAPGFNP